MPNIWSKFLPFLEKELPVAAKPLEQEGSLILPQIEQKQAEILGQGVSKPSIKDLPIEDTDTLSPLLKDVDLPSSLEEKWDKYKKGMAIAGAGVAGTALVSSDLGRSPKEYQQALKESPTQNPEPIQEDDITAPGKASEDSPSMSSKKAEAVGTSAHEKPVESTEELAPRGMASSEMFGKMLESSDKAQLLNQLARIGTQTTYAMMGKESPFEKSFQAQQEMIEKGPQKYLQQVEFQKFDPNSQISQQYRTIAARMGFGKETRGSSASDIEKMFPQLTNIYTQQESRKARHEDLMLKLQEMGLRKQELQQTKEEQQTNKRFDDLNKKLVSEIASSRTTFGTDARTLQGVQNVKALIQGKDPNDLDNREVYEVAKVLDRILSQGAPTISGSAKLTPDTARGLVSKYMEFISNRRVGAGAGSFINRFGKTLDREEDQAKNRIIQTQGKLLSSYSDLQKKDPDKWDLILQQHNIPSDILQKKDGSTIQTKQDPKVAEFSKKYNMTYDDALKLLKKRGYNAQE